MPTINNSQHSPGVSTCPSIGFQAVILCGPGTSLYPFTGAEDLLPKALLPIANKPMIHYPLQWCEKAGFRSTLILTLAEHLVAIQSYIHSHTSPFTIQVEAPSTLDDNLGTADVLRRAYRHGWITSDVVVLPCDLITDLDPEEIVKIWMVENAGFDSDLGNRSINNTNGREGDGRRGGLGVWYETKGEGAFKGQETDLLTLAPHSEPSVGSNPESQYSGTLKTLLYNLPGVAIKEQEAIPFRTSFLRKCRNFQLNLTRRDSGIYFFPFWVLKFIDKNPKMNSIREDVLPWWSKARWQNKRLAERLGLLEILSGNDTPDQEHNIGEMSTTRKRDVGKWTREDDIGISPIYSELDLEVMEKQKRGIVVFRERERVPEPPKSDTSSTTTSLPGDIKIPPMIVYLPEASSAFIRRVDTIQLYLFTSLYLANPAFPSDQTKTHSSASIDQKAHVSRSDCLIASKVTIAERAVVKRCVLGHGVSIAKGAKILGCVLMDGVSVAEGASLEGCIVGRNALIGAEVKLKDCQVSQGFSVEPEVQAKNEIFITFTGLDDDGDVSVTSMPRTTEANEFQKNREQNILDKSYSITKLANVEREEECDERKEIQFDALMAPKPQIQIATQKEIELQVKDIANNQDHKNNESQKADKGQKVDQTLKDTDEVTRVNHRPDRASNTIEKTDKNQKDVKDQEDEKDHKKDEHKMGSKERATEMNHKPVRADNPTKSQDVYTTAQSSPACLDKQQDSSETESLYREAATKQETIKNPTTGSVETTEKEATPEMIFAMAQARPSGLVWAWGLSILTLGAWFVVFTAICTVVERNGDMFWFK